MKVKVDEELCTGCGLCSDNCSEVFELTDDVAQVMVEEVAPEHEDCVRDAADDCPVEAITIIEE
ncbi:MAG: ferredoxin [Candidatus Ratteibacteria bacterium]|nr:ferredoxin [Candidatus Ratteibacteria bacterium]